MAKVSPKSHDQKTKAKLSNLRLEKIGPQCVHVWLTSCTFN